MTFSVEQQLADALIMLGIRYEKDTGQQVDIPSLYPEHRQGGRADLHFALSGLMAEYRRDVGTDGPQDTQDLITATCQDCYGSGYLVGPTLEACSCDYYQPGEAAMYTAFVADLSDVPPAMRTWPQRAILDEYNALQMEG